MDTTRPVSSGAVPEQPGAEDGELPLIAYAVEDGDTPSMPLVAASARRDWIAATEEGFARRCLPLVMAAHNEWWVLNNRTFTVEWLGNRQTSSLRFGYEGDDADAPHTASSLFGHGILTFDIPYLFRTPPGWNLSVRGPANLPKDGVTALAGLVETDWASAFFTMNWQLTRPNTPVEFRAGEPICALVPQRRDELARFRPRVIPLAGSAEEAGYRAFAESRRRFSEERVVPGTPAAATSFQRDYLKGVNPGGEVFADHRRKVKLREFGAGAPVSPPSREGRAAGEQPVAPEQKRGCSDAG
ncbi:MULTISPECIES: DUF6065 family protein [unclassified Streptomyces]|uniref:DUF6065 family protein n=1 Tax=unclassified Streptomyces TaxID=2593676 RepID=UPI00081ED61C|nr:MULTISPECIES: DUF6065 family protein [unclassified Streptomyces]MYZ40640.1 hypothetical protein [Streptomyces sp. SID4917]SCG08223.1 hypothetical protein GA0115259_112542 [Streptomyces sp. MnatMP-M17]